MTDMSIASQVMEALSCLQERRLAEAERLCRAVLEKDPSNLDAYQVLAATQVLGGRHAETVGLLETAIGHHPANAECRVMLGSTLRALGRPAEALEQYRQAVALNPDLVEVHNNMGVLRHDVGELEAAIGCYREALLRQPGHLESRRNLAAALRALGKIEEGLATFEALLQFHPNNAYAALMTMLSKRELCRWQDYDTMTARVHELASTQPGKFSPFLLLAWPIPPAQLLVAAKAYAATFAASSVLPPAPVKVSGSKLRIGYFSPDFRAHVVGKVIPEIFELHDRAAFEVFAYSYGPDDKSPERRRIQAACTSFVDIRALSDDDAAQRIRDNGVDILVDLNGYTGNIRHQILARRPAPVQMSWLGYSGTSGSPAIDYLVADAFTLPTGAEDFYIEKIIYLPGSCQPTDRKKVVGVSNPRAQYGLPEDAFVFCAFNDPYKITPEVFHGWMSVLKAVPGSVLWIRADRDEAVANLKQEAENSGVAAHRLVFAPRTLDPADHLARYGVADLALDTFPYTSHTTANDALWMGCPLVARVGDTFQSRVGGGMLRALDLSELVTDSLAASCEAAIHLATHRDELAAIKARLAAARDTSPHFNMTRFTRHLESAYGQAWSLHTSGEQPRPIVIAAS